MDRLQFEFTMIATNDGKSNVLSITSISTEEGNRYVLPDELKSVIHHTYIVKMNNFSKIKNSIKRRHQSRKIWIKLDEDLKRTYMDEEGNIQFLDQYLEEVSTKQQIDKNDNLQQILEKLIETITKKENQHNLNHISEKFNIEKFSSRNPNAMQWIERFEKECERFNISKDETKIDILRLFLEKSCLDWYSSMAIKLTIKAEWNEWKDKFLETFKNRGWDVVTYALAFRYKEGLLIDYALKKERLILDINKSIDTKTMIDLIATGLPGFILNKLNRDELNDTTDLFNEIRKYEGMMYKKDSTTIKSGKFLYKNKIHEKKPCKTCESLDKGIRYHPEESCWFKKNKNESETGLAKQHEAMLRALSLADRNKALQEELEKVDTLALKVEEDANKRLSCLVNENNFLHTRIEGLTLKNSELEKEVVNIKDIQEKMSVTMKDFNKHLQKCQGKESPVTSRETGTSYEATFVRDLHTKLCESEQNMLLLKKENEDYKSRLARQEENNKQNYKDALSQQLYQYKNLHSMKSTDRGDYLQRDVQKLHSKIDEMTNEIHSLKKDKHEYNMRYKEAIELADKLKRDLVIKQNEIQKLEEENSSYKRTNRTEKASTDLHK